MLNQMAGPMTWELAVDLGEALGQVELLTGHPDTLQKGSTDKVRLDKSVAYRRGNGIVRIWCWLRYALHTLRWVWRFSCRHSDCGVFQSTDLDLGLLASADPTWNAIRHHGA